MGHVPRAVLAALGAALCLQVAWHALRPAPRADADALPPAPQIETLRIASMGDPLVAAKLLTLWLQAFDNQPGISLSFADLDYATVEAWLERILALDPRAQYPLLAATHLYGAVSDKARQRHMLEFVYRQFLLDPNHRWRWMAHAAIAAKHRLGDLALALKYARAITDHATGPNVPGWARHMSVVVLEDLGEVDAAILLVYKLLESGAVSDPHEIRFLNRELDALRAQKAAVP